MALTAAEKQKLYRERLKSKGLYDKVKENDRKRKNEKRKSLSSTQLKTFRLKQKVLQQKCRSKKRTLISKHSTSPYKSPQTLSKAVCRATKSLPSSPRKRTKVVQELVNKYAVLPEPSAPVCKNMLSKEVVESVVKFYQTDDVSWQAPGKKDFVIIRENGSKIKVQKRFLVLTLKEVYALFKQESGMQVSFSKFCDLRPPFVLLQKDIPHNVCICVYHENIRLLLESLSTCLSDFPKTFTNFIPLLVCNENSEACMFSQCEMCKENFNEQFLNRLDQVPNKILTWEQWEKVNQKSLKCKHTDTVENCLKILYNKLPYFLKHTYIKRQQQNFFQEQKKDVSKTKAVIQVDFAENFALKFQNEIQSAHWCNNQVTIFTSYIWLENNDGQGFVFISDDMNHEKTSVYVFLETLILEIKQKYPDIKELSFFSDGAASQFKQRYLFTNLTFLFKHHNLEITWSFFATSHGKGIVDGIGGTVKRLVWRKILCGKLITTAQEFADTAVEHCNNLIIKFVSSEKISDYVDLLNERWQGIAALPDTHSMHFLKPIDYYLIEFSKYSFSNEKSIYDFKEGKVNTLKSSPVKELALKEGDYVVIEWLGKKSSRKYVAQVIVIEDNDIEVLCMRKQDTSGLIYEFPTKEDKCWITKNQILQQLNEPSIITDGSNTRIRSRFKFEKCICAE